MHWRVHFPEATILAGMRSSKQLQIAHRAVKLPSIHFNQLERLFESPILR
jgi:hypothetical protein